MTTFAPDTQFGKYRILRLLGQGGMADVYEAEDSAIGRKVALKILPLAFARDEERTRRFAKEIQACVQLDHPNIVSVFDVGEVDHLHYYSMSVLPGGDLKDRLKQGALKPDVALRITREIASALHYAHEKGFVHRDVKPENILFGEDGRTVLTDFGIARATTGGTRMTATGLSIGTPHYMSPEQARGHDLDGRSDLYALGVVLYELLTGQVPFDAKDSFAVGLQHISDPVPELHPVLAEYQRIIGRLLAKDPDERYQTGAELIEVLDCIQRGEKPVPPRTGTRLVNRVNVKKSSKTTEGAFEGGKYTPWYMSRLKGALYLGLAGAAVAFILAINIFPRPDPQPDRVPAERYLELAEAAMDSNRLDDAERFLSRAEDLGAVGSRFDRARGQLEIDRGGQQHQRNDLEDAQLEKEYLGTLRELVRRNTPPASEDAQYVSCSLRLDQGRGGNLHGVSIIQPCKGDNDFQKSVVQAITSAFKKGVPYRGYENVFQSEIHLDVEMPLELEAIDADDASSSVSHRATVPLWKEGDWIARESLSNPAGIPDLDFGEEGFPVMSMEQRQVMVNASGENRSSELILAVHGSRSDVAADRVDPARVTVALEGEAQYKVIYARTFHSRRPVWLALQSVSLVDRIVQIDGLITQGNTNAQSRDVLWVNDDADLIGVEIESLDRARIKQAASNVTDFRRLQGGPPTFTKEGILMIGFVYRDADASCCPSGGQMRIEYEFREHPRQPRIVPIGYHLLE